MSRAELMEVETTHAEDEPLHRRLARAVLRASAGDEGAREEWRAREGGRWEWRRGGAQVTSSGSEWADLAWQGWNRAAVESLDNFLVEVTVSGQAELAGLSFGPYRDFLTPLEPGRAHHLQFELDVKARRWAFRVDGRLAERQWWNGAVNGLDELLDGTLSLKARSATEVLFHELSVRPFGASCRLSVVITCYRFLQRLRVSLRNWCHQTAPSGAYELIVVNPQSPDGTHEHLAAVARSYPNVRVREVSGMSGTNKGAMINRALELSQGEWILLTDADCVFAPDCVETVLAEVARPGHLYYGRRRFLNGRQTAAALSGAADALHDFAALAGAAESEESHPWGYTQIVHRTVLQNTPYRESHDHFAHSDGIFIEDCRRRGVLPSRIEGLVCLHLEHPFAWYGTQAFL